VTVVDAATRHTALSGWLGRARPVITVVAIAAGLYVLLVGNLFVFQRSMLYPANQYRPAPAAMQVPELQVVTLRTRDGLDLIAWYGAPRAGKPTVVSFHGNGDFIGANSGFARLLLDRGYGVLLTSYRGYSGNPGAPTEEGLYDDGRAAMDFVEARGAVVVLHGFSLGSGVAVQMATERKVAAMILEAPFTAAVDVAASAYPFVPVHLLMHDRFDSLAKLGAIAVPVLVTHGTRDEVVPAAQFDRIYEAIRGQKTRNRIEGASHNDLWQRGSGEAAIAFLERLSAESLWAPTRAPNASSR
jgi:fermentation-respiration switch protein FrsA (DUF1100 family)